MKNYWYMGIWYIVRGTRTICFFRVAVVTGLDVAIRTRINDLQGRDIVPVRPLALGCMPLRNYMDAAASDEEDAAAA